MYCKFMEEKKKKEERMKSLLINEREEISIKYISIIEI